MVSDERVVGETHHRRIPSCRNGPCRNRKSSLVSLNKVRSIIRVHRHDSSPVSHAGGATLLRNKLVSKSGNVSITRSIGSRSGHDLRTTAKLHILRLNGYRGAIITQIPDDHHIAHQNRRITGHSDFIDAPGHCHVDA